MVDNKELLKNKIQSDLKRKIQNVQRITEELESKVKLIQQHCDCGKDEVNKTVELLKEKFLNKRKEELKRQIDNAFNSRMDKIKDEIKSKYVALGCLQNTLSNLDSFNQSQLIKLQQQTYIPDTSKFNEPRDSLFVNLDFSLVEKDIENWGEILIIQQEQKCNKRKELKDNCEDDFEIIDALEHPEKVHSFDIRKLVPKTLNSIQPEITNDLSKWLKPKICSKKENLNPVISNANATPPHIHNPLKNQLVDIPCLRTELDIWVPTKKAKFTSNSGCLDTVKDIFPPQYSLPAHFWLKQK